MTANDKNTSTLVVTSQHSDAYNAPTQELESFLHGSSLLRCHTQTQLKEKSILLNVTHFNTDSGVLTDNMTRYFNASFS